MVSGFLVVLTGMPVVVRGGYRATMACCDSILGLITDVSNVFKSILPESARLVALELLDELDDNSDDPLSELLEEFHPPEEQDHVRFDDFDTRVEVRTPPPYGDAGEWRPLQAIPEDVWNGPMRTIRVRDTKESAFRRYVLCVVNNEFGRELEASKLNREMIRQFVVKSLREHGLRPSHVHEHARAVCLLYWIPSEEDIMAAQVMQSLPIRDRNDLAQMGWRPNWWSRHRPGLTSGL